MLIISLKEDILIMAVVRHEEKDKQLLSSVWEIIHEDNEAFRVYREHGLKSENIQKWQQRVFLLLQTSW